MKIAIALFALTISTPAYAQLKLPIVVFAGAASADAASTYVALRSYDMKENNPLVNWIDNRNAMLAFGATLETLAVAYAVKKIAPRHPRFVKVGLFLAAGAHAAFAARNVHRMKQERR